MQEQDQQFVEFIVKSLVDHPDDVKTDRSVDEMGVLITLHLNQEDMGQVIGRQGQTAKAIRTLLRVVGAKRKARVNLKINEPEGSMRHIHGPSEHGDHGHSAPHTEHAGLGDQSDQGMPSAKSDPLDIDEFKL